VDSGDVLELTAGSRFRRFTASSSAETRLWLLVAGFTAVGLVLRLLGLNESLFGDEWITFDDVTGRSISGVIHTIAHGAALEQSPPLFFALAWATAKIGDPTVWIRLPSLIFGTASVPVVYLLGRQLLGPKSGLVGAGFIALSPFTIFYSTEARPYATLMFFVALSTLCLLVALRSGNWRWWAAYGVAVCGALYTHYTSVFVLGAQAAWALFAYRRCARAWLVTHVCVALAFLPWLPHLAGRNLAVFDLTAQPTGQAIGRALLGHPYISLRSVPGPLCLAVLGVALAISVGATAVRRQSTSDGESSRRGPLLLTLGLALATPAGLAVYSSFSHDLFSSRNLISALPYVAILVAWILTRSDRVWSNTAAAIALLAMGIGGAESLLSDNRRPAFEDAAHYIDSVARSADTVMCWTSTTPGSYARAISLNFQRPHVCVGPNDPQTKARIARGGRLFTVMLLAADSGPAPTLVPSTDFSGGRAKVVTQRTYPGFVRVRVLQLQALTPPMR
jgi:hypothetical protein